LEGPLTLHSFRYKLKASACLVTKRVTLKFDLDNYENGYAATREDFPADDSSAMGLED
jgi:hypothetical protein